MLKFYTLLFILLLPNSVIFSQKLIHYQEENEDGIFEEGYKTETGEKYCTVYTIGESADFYSGGLRRIVKDNYIGFINKKGKVIITPAYCQAESFSRKKCAVNTNGILTDHSSTDANSEPTWEGGKWGIINKKGKVIKPCIYTRTWNEKYGCYEYSANNERFLFTGKGKIKKL